MTLKGNTLQSLLESLVESFFLLHKLFGNFVFKFDSKLCIEMFFCVFQVHMCNKLASRHVRVGLAEPSNAPCCDICENAPGLFFFSFFFFIFYYKTRLMMFLCFCVLCRRNLIPFFPSPLLSSQPSFTVR